MDLVDTLEGSSVLGFHHSLSNSRPVHEDKFPCTDPSEKICWGRVSPPSNMRSERRFYK